MKAFGLRAWSALFLLAGMAGMAGMAASAQTGRPIVVIPITGTVDDGMAHLVERSVA